MKRTRLLWQIYVPIVLVIILSVTSFTWYASRSFNTFFIDQTKSDLEVRANLIKAKVSLLFFDENYPALQQYCKDVSQNSATRITIILPSGQVVVDSVEDPSKMDNHSDRTEILDVLAGRLGSSIRFSHTLQKNMLYVAIPLIGNNQHLGAILRLSIPITAIDQTLTTIRAKVIFGSVVLIILAALIILTISRQVSRPLEEMRLVAEHFAEGNMGETFNLSQRQNTSIEVADLGDSMNKMASQLNERFETITSQHNELKAVFSSMVEAVLVVDDSERLINVNNAAEKYFHLKNPVPEGISIDNAIKNPDIIKFIRKMISQTEPIEDEIFSHKGNDVVSLQAHGAPLRDSDNNIIGGLIVLNDVSRLKKLENIRKDFVANVSHELRTPITTIKGFVETLRDGAMANPQEAERFIGIILKNADRLNAIVEDLLTLSRIEQEDEQGEIEFQSNKMQPLLQNVIETCAMTAQEKEITLRLECDAELTNLINAPLLEQAVTNLVVNAIKYSHKNSYIEIKVIKRDDILAIQVEDYGVGIDKVHIPRLFERFYRSDKARSRKLGGTGLGLAIVKHIVQAHNGQLHVDSTLDEGTVFTIEIPVRT